MELKKLHLGCGTNIKAGWINLDIAPLPGVDVVHDIGKSPLPFRDEEFDEVLCEDILEHLEYIPIMREINRIMKRGGVLTIRVPHFTSRNNFIDPTHKKMFSISTLDFFVRGTTQYRKRPYYFDFSFERYREKKIEFEHSSFIFFLNALIEPFINSGPRMQEFYEATFLSRLFPAYNMRVTLIK